MPQIPPRPPHSAATDFLTEWIQKAEVRAPSITVTIAQRWPVVGTPPNFRPGLTGYGWGINGEPMEGFRGPVGLLFRYVLLWFSDRGQDIESPDDFGQQFLASAHDEAWIELTFAGDAVQLQIQYKRAIAWEYNVTATTTQVDQPSQQLLFSDLPPLGADPVQAFMIISLADTGGFAWL